MDFFSEIARFIHVAFGAVGLAAFWIPVFARKGAVNHVRFGKVFVYSAYIVLGAAAIALLARLADLASRNISPADEPMLFAFIVFLGYLTFVTFVIVRHGMEVLRHKRDPAALRTTLNIALAYASIAASAGIILYAMLYSPPNKILLFALSPIGFGNGYGQLQYMKSSRPSKRGWMYEHLGAMLGSGIAFHTAFAVFGSTRLFDIGLTGWIAIIPWVAPTIIGLPAIVIWTRHYRRQFGELA
ncbi:MAG: hypothetical protein ACR2P6_05455 [Gammaproteobacteria bacterium]